MDLDDIKQILILFHEHDLDEFELERDGLKVRIRKAGRGVTFTAPAVAAPPASVVPSAEPGAPSFVDVGHVVKKGQVLCIIEAMKLMNEIESDCDGEIIQIYVENGKPVQFGDRLFAVKVA